MNEPINTNVNNFEIGIQSNQVNPVNMRVTNEIVIHACNGCILFPINILMFLVGIGCYGWCNIKPWVSCYWHTTWNNSYHHFNRSFLRLLRKWPKWGICDNFLRKIQRNCKRQWILLDKPTNQQKTNFPKIKQLKRRSHQGQR